MLTALKKKYETGVRYTGTCLYICDGNVLKIQIVKRIKLDIVSQNVYKHVIDNVFLQCYFVF